ncbi:MAG TPA: hypothetical protein DDW81_07270, partial [Cryomorphaceae bacterium]|nr:hypothetical protein [Cryomorphaceae bacterium]
GLGESTRNGITLYPNPARDHLSLQSSMGEALDVIIYNTKGQEVSRHTGVEKDQDLSINHLSPGLYLVRISHQGQLLQEERLVVEG